MTNNKTQLFSEVDFLNSIGSYLYLVKGEEVFLFLPSNLDTQTKHGQLSRMDGRSFYKEVCSMGRNGSGCSSVLNGLFLIEKLHSGVFLKEN